MGRTIAIVGLVAIGAAAAANYNRLRGAADEVATRVHTALAAASAQRNPPLTGAREPAPVEARAPDALPDSESELAADQQPTGSQTAAPAGLPAPHAAEPTPPPRQDRVGEPGSALAAVDPAPPNARARAHAPFVFARSAVTVSESQSAAALTIRRSDGAAGPGSVVWWCRDGTAIANKDFADLGRRTESFAARENSRTIFVPIIKDGKPGVNRHFFVYLGEYDGDHRRLQVLSTVRVEIDDDD